MKMRLPRCVILCSGVLFCSVWSAISPSVFAYSFKVPEKPCVLVTSLRTPADVITVAMARLKERFSNACEESTEKWDDPFSDRAGLFWKRESDARDFGFWLDVTEDGGDVHMRGIDLHSTLEWGHLKASTVGLSSDAKISLMKNLVDQLVDEYPLVGLVEQDGFYTWNRSPLLKVVVIEREGVDRHPFLPALLNIRAKEIEASSAQLDQDEKKRWKLSFFKDFKADAGKRLWLKLGLGGGRE